jgi:hypothetical protein
MEVNGYKVIIEDYDVWKEKMANLEIRAKFKAEDIISMYERDGNPDVMIVGGDIVDNEYWEISIEPENKIVKCRFYKQ